MKNICCLGLLGIASLQVFSAAPSFAQSNIVPDNTLGNENSRVEVLNSNGSPVDLISGGAIEEKNLFHSFQEFNIGDGRTADFINSSNNIQNILTRITGNNPSNIFGTLRVSNSAGVTSNPNFFLINPNGIVFGENASLDVGGSFVASTANAIEFGDRGFFSASEPETPQLLTINPSALFFNQVAAASIENQSRADGGRDPSNSFNTFGLRVPDGKSFLLAGGDINIDGGGIVAFGGRVDLSSIAGVGRVELNQDSDNLSWSLPETTSRGNITLSNDARVIVSAGGGGDIAIAGENINIVGRSSLNAGILSQLGSVDAQAGDITLNATDSIRTSDDSRVFNGVNQNAVGNSGNIDIKAKQLNIIGGAQVSALTFGQGDTGNITVSASESVELKGGDTGSLTGLFAQVGQQGVGNGGNILVEAEDLKISKGAQISAGTFGEGNAGNLNIHVNDLLELTGDGEFPSGLFAEVASNGAGTSGDLIVETGSLRVTDGARISASTFGEGNAGRVIINAQERVFLEEDENNNTFINNNVGTFALGNTSGIDITTDSLSVNNGAQIQSNTRGRGNSGQIRIVARGKVSFDGNNGSPSGAFSLVDPTARGTSGGIEIIADSLDLHNRAQLGSWTDGTGNSGDIHINAQDQVSLINSLIISEVTDRGGVGDAGDIKITTGSLFLKDASSILADTENRGNAGNITIEARDQIVLEGEGSAASNFDRVISNRISTTVESNAVGEGGDINIKAGSLFFADGAQLRSETLGQGDSGNIFLQVRDKISLSNSLILSEVSELGGIGDAGDIKITTGSLFLEDASSILADTENQGNAGNITIEARDKVVLRGEGPAASNPNQIVSSQISATVESDAVGKAGNINISAKQISVEDDGFISSRTFAREDAGTINFATEKLFLNDGTILTSSDFSSGGAINIAANDIRLFGDSDIRTNVNSGVGGGGNINLTADTIIALDDSDILSFARDGRGGDISFNTEGLFSSSQFLPASPLTNSNNLEQNDRIDINASGAISGNITGIPDTTFIQNSLTELPENQIDTNALISQTCIARSNDTGSTFNITGSGGFADAPGNADISNYPTNRVRGIPKTTSRQWTKGDPIIEPEGVYRLADGRLALSRECK